MGNVVDMCGALDAMQRLPEWYRPLHRAPVYWHRSILDLFRMVKSRTRFVDGCAWFCRGCGMPAAVRFDFVKHLGIWVTARVVCHLGCWTIWRLDATESALDAWFAAEEENAGDPVPVH